MIVELNICNKCNGYCTYCPYKDPDEYEQMSGEVFDKVFELCTGDDIKQVNIGGFCEPTYHTGMITMIRKLLPYVDIDLSTNTIIMYRLFDLLPYNITFSLHKLASQDKGYYKLFDMFVDMLNNNHRTYHVNDNRTMNKLSRCGLSPATKDGCCERETGHSYITDRLTIDYNGDVILCCNDWGKHRFGNIMTDSLETIRTAKYNYLVNMRYEVDPKADYPCFKCEHGIRRV